MSEAVGFEITDEIAALVQASRTARQIHMQAVIELTEAMDEMRLTGRVFIEVGDQVADMKQVPVTGKAHRWIVRFVDPEGEVVLVEDIDSEEPPYNRYLKLHIGQCWLVKKGNDGLANDRSRNRRGPDGGLAPGRAKAAPTAT